jgi:hypothetical protein
LQTNYSWVESACGAIQKKTQSLGWERGGIQEIDTKCTSRGELQVQASDMSPNITLEGEVI